MPSADRMASTLPPIPSFNKDVPVVTSAGGTADAYKDPNSPESILKKTATLQAQVAVDQRYDVAVSPYYEPFTNYETTSIIQSLLIFIILTFIMLVSIKTFLLRTFILTFANILIFFVIHLSVDDRAGATNIYSDT